MQLDCIGACILFFPLDRSSVLPNRYFFPGRSHILLSVRLVSLESDSTVGVQTHCLECCYHIPRSTLRGRLWGKAITRDGFRRVSSPRG